MLLFDIWEVVIHYFCTVLIFAFYILDVMCNYVFSQQNLTPEQFDPTSLTADCINVDLRITKPSEIKLYGSVLRMFINLKVSVSW